jgi:hypothetical protein
MQRFENKFHHDQSPYQSPFDDGEYYGIDEWFYKDHVSEDIPCKVTISTNSP